MEENMQTLFIGSTAGNSGKTLITVGLGLTLKESGYKVGYLKALGKAPTIIEGKTVDADAHFIRGILQLTEPLEQLCPVILTQDLVARGLRGEVPDLRAKILQAFEAVAAGKDIVLVGGSGSLGDGAFLGISGTRMAKELRASVLLVHSYMNEVCVDCILNTKEILGDHLMGTVINRVPPQSLHEVEQTVVPFLVSKNIEVMGVLPLDRVLDAITVRQMAEALDGKVICAHEGLDEFVERFSVGAMDVDAALGYFRKLPNKAVITGGNRADIQLAALETSTKCIVLTGNQMPNEIIISRARELRVPMISVHYDTLTTVEKLEGMLGRIRIREERKIQRARELLRDRLNFRRIIEKLGLR